jgi:hypothetical protein
LTWYARVQHATDQMEDTLVHDEDTRTFEPEVRAGIERASKKLYDALDKNIDKFELYIVRNIFKVCFSRIRTQ